MGLRELVLAAAIAFAPATALGQEQPKKEIVTKEVKQKEEHLNLALKYGTTFFNNRWYENRSVAMGLNGYLIEFRFRKEETTRTSEEELKVAGLKQQGTQHTRDYQADVTFGYELFEFGRNLYTIKFFGHVVGGLQLESNALKLKEGGKKLPGELDLDLLLGSGARAETVFHLPKRWTFIPLAVGFGGTLERLDKSIKEEMRSDGADVMNMLFVRNAINDNKGLIYDFADVLDERMKSGREYLIGEGFNEYQSLDDENTFKVILGSG